MIATDERIKAIGEIGLDYHWGDIEREVQKKAFIEQLQLANKCNKPVLIHMRDATGDTMQLLKEYKQTKGILHCYSGSVETAQEAIKMNMYLAVGGPLTFKNARGLPEVMAQLPLNRKQNEPMYMVHTFEKLAAIRQMDQTSLMNELKKNYFELFR